MRIVVDTTILVRATEKSHGPARELLSEVISGHTLVLSNEILHEPARVLRYPRLREFYGLSEARIYDFIEFLRDAAEIVALSPLLVLPTRDETTSLFCRLQFLATPMLSAPTMRTSTIPRRSNFCISSALKLWMMCRCYGGCAGDWN